MVSKLDDVAAGVLILFGIHLGWHGPGPGAWAGPCEPRSLSAKIPALVMKATPAGPRPSLRDVPFFAVTLRSVEKPEVALRSTALEAVFQLPVSQVACH